MKQNHQIRSFFMLHFHTKILEACNWDEELTNECIGLLDYELSVANRSELKTINSILKHVAASLLETHKPRIVEAIIEVLDESLQHAPFLIDMHTTTSTKYEN